MSSTQNDGAVTSAVRIHTVTLEGSGHYSEPPEGNPARETQFDVISWLHLPQPKLNIYVCKLACRIYTLTQFGGHLYFSGSSYLRSRRWLMPSANRGTDNDVENPIRGSQFTCASPSYAFRCELLPVGGKLRELPKGRNREGRF